MRDYNKILDNIIKVKVIEEYEEIFILCYLKEITEDCEEECKEFIFNVKGINFFEIDKKKYKFESCINYKDKSVMFKINLK